MEICVYKKTAHTLSRQVLGLKPLGGMAATLPLRTLEKNNGIKNKDCKGGIKRREI